MRNLNHIFRIYEIKPDKLVKAKLEIWYDKSREYFEYGCDWLSKKAAKQAIQDFGMHKVNYKIVEVFIRK